MTLSKGEVGKSYIVNKIELDEALIRRLYILGLTQGTVFQLLNRKRNGAVIFKVRGTRFAIGKKVADGIVIGGTWNEQ